MFSISLMLNHKIIDIQKYLNRISLVKVWF